MDKDWRNPYVAGNPIRSKEMFYGRDNILAWLRNHLIGRFQDNVIVLYGERRIGKTSILYQVSRWLEGSPYIPILIDLEQLSLDADNSFWWQIAFIIWSELSRLEGVDTLERPKQEDFVGAPGVYFAEGFLNQVQKAIGQRKLLVMFDEFTQINEKVEAGNLSSDVFVNLHSLMRNHRLTLIVSLGSKLEEMEKQYNVLFDHAINHKITFLDEADARALITQPVADYDCTYQDEAIDLILRATSGHPFYIQHICHAIFARRGIDNTQPVTVDEVAQGLPDVVEAIAPNLKFIWDDVGYVEWAVVAALATLINKTGDTATRAEVVHLLRNYRIYPPDGELTAALKTLRGRDILREETIGEYTFTVEPLRLWLSKERRLDFVRHELDIAGIINRWPPVEPLALIMSWLRQPIYITSLATALVIIGVIWVLFGWSPPLMPTLTTPTIESDPATSVVTSIPTPPPAITTPIASAITLTPTPNATTTAAIPTSTPNAAVTAAETSATAAAAIPTSIPSPTDTPTLSATFPPPTPTPLNLSGKLAFPVDDGFGRYDIHIVSMADGKELGTIRGARQPNFRYDGEKLLVNAEQGYSDEENIHVADPNGSIETLVSDSDTDSHPAYNPDGTRVVYGNPNSQFLFVQCFLKPPSQESDDNCKDPNNLRLIPQERREIIGNHPVWTSDDRIAYRGCNSWEDNKSSTCGIFIVQSWATRPKNNGVGINPTEIFTGTVEAYPTDSKKNWIAYHMKGDSSDWEAYVIDLDSREIVNISNSPSSSDGLPTLSPDGQWVAFASNREGEDKWAIYVAPIRGGQARKVRDFPKANPWGSGDRDWTNERMSWGP